MFDTIKILRRRLSGIVDSKGSPLYDERECRALADLLLEEVCGLTRVDRIMHPERVLPAEQRQRLGDIRKQFRDPGSPSACHNDCSQFDFLFSRKSPDTFET